VEPAPGDATPAVPRPRAAHAEVHQPHSPVSADPYLELGAGLDGDWKLPVVESH
jgi:hypothetical protein